jgi:beta-mannosidase
MNKITLSLLFTLMMLTKANSQEVELSWQIFHPLKNVWLELGAKGSVQEAFYRLGELPDPFVEKNEDLYQWMENHQWIFRSRMEVTEEILKADYIDLDFHNVDTYADIYVNDSLIGKTDNAFHPYSFSIKSALKLGVNHFKVVFTSPVQYHEEAYSKAKTKLPAPNDGNPIAIAPYSRKPQYQFGWDWSLRMNTMGFWKPVVVRAYQVNKIASHNIQTLSVSENKAELSLKLSLKDVSKSDLTWTSELFGNQIIAAGSINSSRELAMDNPILWWPKGQGDQHLYTDIWTIRTDAGEIIDTRTVTFGIRTSELIQEKDEVGTSYEIKVNGRTIFCKGGDYIPQDIFPSRVTDQHITNMVTSMAEANFNMVRVWGGGYYPDEVFYQKCDELGLMVWQDFMFACSMYPGDDAFLKNVKQEFDYQIPRISSHPSVVLFNGNNEVDVAWKNWGFQARYLIYGKEAEKIEQDYKTLFQVFIPERINALSSVPYIHTSPLSNWGKDEFYNHGSQHYWGVWHGKDPIEDFGRKSGRFNAEYGFQSFPQMSTIHTFAAKKDWDLESDIMKHHQKSYVGNGMMLKHAKILYGQPETFEEFVYYSLVTQAKAVGIAIGAHRAQAPRCMGTLYWQVNDCWTAPSWSSIDYFGNWKPLHFQAQRDYAEVTVVERIDKLNAEQYYLVSTLNGLNEVKIVTTIFDLSGNLIGQEMEKAEVQMNHSKKVALMTQDQKFQSQNFVVKFEISLGDKLIQTRTFSHLPNPPKPALCSALDYEISYDKETGRGELIIENQKYIRNLFITAKKNGLKVENNFIDLLPGKYSFVFTSKEIITKDDILLNWM